MDTEMENISLFHFNLNNIKTKLYNSDYQVHKIIHVRFLIIRISGASYRLFILGVPL